MNPVVFKLQHNDWINNYLGIGDFKSSFSRVSWRTQKSLRCSTNRERFSRHKSLSDMFETARKVCRKMIASVLK